MQSWCEIDWDRCIGCQLCIRVPTKKSEPYQVTVCPWGAITMVPVERMPEEVDHLGGPPHYAEENRSRFLQAAERQVRLMRGR
jgi:electron transport complex protein RnfB